MSVNNQSKLYPTTIDELCEKQLESGKYEHLKIILSKNDNHRFGQNYMYISRSAFGKVKLIDLDFIDGHLYIELQDCSNGLFIHNSFDVDDKEFKFLLISWQDIRNMVLTESCTKLSHDEMLEFEF